MKPPLPHRNLRADRGQITAFAVIITAALLLVAGLVVDGGEALAADLRAHDQAQEAARAGAQALDLARYRATGAIQLDPAAAWQAANHYLQAAGEPGRYAITVTGNQVQVSVDRSQPTQLLHLAGITHLKVHATATATAEHGVLTATSRP